MVEVLLIIMSATFLGSMSFVYWIHIREKRLQDTYLKFLQENTRGNEKLHQGLVENTKALMGFNKYTSEKLMEQRRSKHEIENPKSEIENE